MTYIHRVSARVFGAMPLLLVGAALSQDGINLHIVNDGIADIYVSVYDTNLHAPIVEHQRLNGFDQLPITASADEKGRANITWKTISVDSREQHCGSGGGTDLENSATVNVHADSSC